jgi:CheY-like chemotaxis protein
MARSILLADDSPTIRKIVELTFADSDLRVESAETGREALEKIESLHPDLVLADVVMPDPAGYELCRAVKGSGRPVPVILLAGTFEPFDARQAEECGADAHIVKPFESGALREKVEELLGVAEAEREAASETVPAPPELEHVMEELSESAEEGATVAETASQVAEEAPPEGDGDAEEEAGPAPDVDPALVDAVAREVVKRLSEIVIREIAWEVVPDLATKIVRERIRELEADETDED